MQRLAGKRVVEYWRITQTSYEVSTGKYKQVHSASNALRIPLFSITAVGSLYPTLLFHFCLLCEAMSTKYLRRETFVEEKHQKQHFVSGDSCLYSFYFIFLSQQL